MQGYGVAEISEKKGFLLKFFLGKFWRRVRNNNGTREPSINTNRPKKIDKDKFQAENKAHKLLKKELGQ